MITLIDSLTGIPCSDSSSIDSIVVIPSPPPVTITGPVLVDCGTYHLQLTAFDALAGRYNWSNGTTGAVDDIYSGGLYNVVFTDPNGCTSSAAVNVPFAPDTYLPYFPSGCYTICQQQLALALYGPPDVSFNYWAWLDNGDTALSGTGDMAPYSIDASGNYQWYFNNGLCGKSTDTMNVNVIECDGCHQTGLNATVTCVSVNPASYSIYVSFYSPAAGTSYTIGTDIGPISPFSGILASTGGYGLTLTFTTLEVPTPDSVTVELAFTLPDGSRCFTKQKVLLPPCGWIAERHAATDSTKHGDPALTMTNALLVFPNPTSGDVTISYDYGTESEGDRTLTIFDAVGRKVSSTAPQDTHGNWMVSSHDWTSGIYIVRMEAGGKTLQVQRMVVTGK